MTWPERMGGWGPGLPYAEARGYKKAETPAGCPINICRRGG